MAGKADYSDQEIREAVARAMLDEAEESRTETGAEAIAAVDPKKLFCENWDTVKRVLEFLKGYLPKKLQGIVDMIIKAGDTLKRLICG